MELLDGKIIDVSPAGLTIFVPYPNTDRYIKREYDDVVVGLEDGRKLRPDQRRKAYALMGEISEWAGVELEDAKLVAKHRFVADHLEGLTKEIFSLSNCDVTTAKEFISYLIDFIIQFEIPTKIPLVEYCDDVSRYMRACLEHKQCAVCGQRADLHHVDRVGMGNDRKTINHLGLRCLPLCREHHNEAHQHGDEQLMTKYHLEPVVIDEKIAKIYKLNKKGTGKS